MNYFYKRVIEPMQFRREQNAIIRYINCQDYRNGIAAKKGPSSSSSHPFQAAHYLNGLLNVCDHTTHAEKVAFLQNPNSQRKLFKIINGLFLYFHNAWCNRLSLTYLDKLLELLALDISVEEAFYNSPGFITICLKEIFPELYQLALDDSSGKNRFGVRNLVLAAVQKYPDLELTLFSNQNIQDLIINIDVRYSPLYPTDPIQQIARFLFILSRTSIYANGLLTNQAILNNIPSIEIKFNSNVSAATIFHASILVTFMDDPHQLIDYFPSCAQQLIERLNKIIEAEISLRNKNIEPTLFFDGSCSLNFDLPHYKRYKLLVSSLTYTFERELQWKSTFFSTSSRKDCITQINTFRSYVLLGNYLSKETNKTDYIKLLDQGYSSDFAARIALHDMLCPQQRLTPQLLSYDLEDADLIACQKI